MVVVLGGQGWTFVVGGKECHGGGFLGGDVHASRC